MDMKSIFRHKSYVQIDCSTLWQLFFRLISAGMMFVNLKGGNWG
jgi:hypothetical protein